MQKKSYPLPKRFSVGMSEKAYANLRALNAKYTYGNNYLLTILLENIDQISTPRKLNRVFARFAAEYGAPERTSMRR